MGVEFKTTHHIPECIHCIMHVLWIKAIGGRPSIGSKVLH